MPRQFKNARKMNKLKLLEVAEKLGVSQPTVSSWESGRKSPPLDQLVAMSELYEVSTDYLLGLTENTMKVSDKKIPFENYRIMHGQPVWSNKFGWLLTDAVNETFLSDSGIRISFKDAGELFYMAPTFVYELLPTEKPIEYCNIRNYEKVWVEPISQDTNLRKELRGWYTVNNDYVENEFGNRFYIDMYGNKWLCFREFELEFKG